jgi:hypothetical protein
MSLRVKYHLLKEAMNLLGILEYAALGGGLYYLIERELSNSLLLFVLMGCFLWASSELGYYVNQLQIRLELSKQNDRRD